MDYDGNGNIIYQKDPNGNETDFEYNFRNQVTKKTLIDNVYEFDYDTDGNMIKAIDSDTQIDLTYQEIKGEYFVKTAKTSGRNGFSLPSPTLTYFYDEFGNRTEMSNPYGSNFIYNYNQASNRLNKITNHKGEEFDFEYDDVSRLSKIKNEAFESIYAYDANSFLTSTSHKKSNGTSINFFNYQRDPNGNRTKITTKAGDFNYAYDEENQLTWMENPETTGSFQTETFTYDNLGNRLNDQLGSYIYDQKSQRLTEDYNNIYLYDTNGNLTSIQEKGMTGNYKNLNYSSENQLVKIDTYESNFLIKEVTYRYDGLGRRVVKEIIDHQAAGNSFERKYIYDGQEILAEYDESGTTLAVYTHSTLRTDDVLSVEVKSTKLASQTGSYFFSKDGLGSIIDITNSSGDIVQHYSYSSFGKILKVTDGSNVDVTSNPVVKTSYGFTNREHDVESGMMYYRARYMMPEIGRFIQEDPHPGKLSQPTTYTSKYIYVLNNPTNLVDPEGRIAWVLFFIAGAIGGHTASENGGNWLEGFAIGALSFTAGYFLGPWISSYLGYGKTGSILFGGLAGGVVGALGHNQLGVSQEEGFVIGFAIGVMGGSKGYSDGIGRSPAAELFLNEEDPYSCLIRQITQAASIAIQYYTGGDANSELIDINGSDPYGNPVSGRGCYGTSCKPYNSAFECKEVIKGSGI